MKQFSVGMPQEGIKAATLIDDSVIFPVSIDIENHTPKKLVLPMIAAVVPPHSSCLVKVKSKDSLVGAITDIESVAEMSSYEIAATLRFQEASDSQSDQKSESSDNQVEGESAADPEETDDEKPNASAKSASSNVSAGSQPAKIRRGRKTEPVANKAEDK